MGSALQNFLLTITVVAFIAACSSKNAAVTPSHVPDMEPLDSLSAITNIPLAKKTPTPTKTNTPSNGITSTATFSPPDQILYSPNGQFIAEFDNAYAHAGYHKQIIEILDKNNLLLWEIPYQGETSMSDPHPSLSIYGWSKDSTYLYFQYVFWPDGGDRAFWWDGYDLQRINVQNGDIEQVIPGEGFVAFALSPDESEIAFTRQQDDPAVIFIRNLSTGAEKRAAVIFPSKNYIRVGDIHWSPSGNEIAFQTETKDYMVQTIYLDPATMEQKVVREYRLFDLWFKGWSSDGQLEFSEKGNLVHVNGKNNETTIIGTLTPMP
jgi:hypothetical protein